MKDIWKEKTNIKEDNPNPIGEDLADLNAQT